jgi:myo-inositol catabolism protein IolS
VKYRNFGPIKFEVSQVGFGGGAISGEGGGYGFGAISESDAIDLLHASFDAGINLFDTAPIYGFGESERRIGKAFKSCREKVFIVSKSGVTWDRNRRVDMNNDPRVTSAMLEQSLRDLQTEYIDLYMIHWPDPRVDIRRPMEVLAEALDQQKIRSIGLSNTNLQDYQGASSVAPVSVFQAEYNLFCRNPEQQILPLSEQQNIGFMSWGTLDKGIITGRVTADRKFDSYDARSRAPWWKSEDRTWKYNAMTELNHKLVELEHTGLELALSAVLSNPVVSTALCGPRSISQLDTLIGSLNNMLPLENLENCREIIEEHRPS